MSLSSPHKLPETKGAGRVIPKLMAKHCFRFGVFLFFSFLFFLLLTGIHRPGVEIPLLTVSPSTCLVRHANTSCCFEPLHNSWQRRRETKKKQKRVLAAAACGDSPHVLPSPMKMNRVFITLFLSFLFFHHVTCRV